VALFIRREKMKKIWAVRRIGGYKEQDEFDDNKKVGS